MTMSYRVYLSHFLSFLVAQFGAGAGALLLGGKTLKIGIPMKTDFTEFVDVKLNGTNQTIPNEVSGYSIDIFKASLSYLEGLGLHVSYVFEAFVNTEGKRAGSYNQLLHQIPEKYDAVVGDVTIVANRSTFVDFTLPYAESGVRMLIQVRHSRHLDMWIFLQPFSWDLWLSIITFCVFIGFALLFMERNAKKDAAIEDSSSSRKQVNGPSILWLPLAQAVLPERESVAKKCSRFVLLVWLGLAFILMQSYTASLSSILTLDQIKPSYPTIDSLKRDNENVGYRCGSFVGDFLRDHLQFDESRLKNYSKIEDYRDALSKGTRNGGIGAMFDELPYNKVFLKKYGSKFMMAGPTYRNDGFGFAFPQGSNLTSYFSRAILNVTEGPMMDKIEEKYFGNNPDIFQDQYDQISEETPSLTTQSFAGLFIITGSLILLALLVSERRIWKKPVMVAKNLSQRFLLSSRSTRINTSEDSSTLPV